MSHRFLDGWLLPILAMAGTAAYVVFGFLPAQRSLAELRQDLAAKQESAAQAGALAPAVEATQREWDETRLYNQAWLNTSPSPETVPQLFGQINALAQQSGATITRFNPEPVESFERLRRIPVLVGCQGSFVQVCEFLQSVEQMPQAIWMDDLRIEKNGKDEDSVTVEASLAIFADNPESSNQVTRSDGR